MHFSVDEALNDGRDAPVPLGPGHLLEEPPLIFGNANARGVRASRCHGFGSFVVVVHHDGTLLALALPPVKGVSRGITYNHVLNFLH